MASYEASLLLMGRPAEWPMVTLPLKRVGTRHGRGGASLPSFACLHNDGVTPLRIRDDAGAVIVEYRNAVEAVEDGWRVD